MRNTLAAGNTTLTLTNYPSNPRYAGDAPEDKPPLRPLSPCELLLMKNKNGHTPIIKAFAGGVHMSVIR